MLKASFLGKFDIRIGEEPVQLTSKPAQNVLAYLLLNGSTLHRRERLAGLFWPDSAESSARKNLRNAVWQIRKAIGQQYLLTDKGTVSFNTSEPYWLDVKVLADDSAEHDTKTLIEAVACYEGDLLPGFYEDWVLLERERLCSLFERRMQKLLEQLTAEEKWPEILTWAEHWIAQGRVPEPAFRALMTGHAGLGDMAGTVATYRRCVRLLHDELGVSPSTETEALYVRLTGNHLEVEEASTAVPVVTQAPGDHGPAELDRSHSLMLPADATPFVGREEELARIGEMLADQKCRLLTLVGQGGIGKTRLAMSAARMIHNERPPQFVDGVVFVALAGAEPADAIPATLAKSLDLSLAGQLDPMTGVSNYLASKEMLLVLDNFEQLLDGTHYLVQLLEECTRVKLMVTSREPLRLSAEWRFDVEGLPFPGEGDFSKVTALDRYEAVQLFVQTARQVRPGFQLTNETAADVGGLCRLVAGMPLALKLAASWLQVVSVEQVVEEVNRNLDVLSSRLRDVPARQRSMRAIFEYSWSSLSPDEQQAFQKLSVFRGGFTGEAAEMVADVSPFGMMGLVDHGLVQFAGDGRYDVHELTRKFAAEKLADSGLATLAESRHGEYYLNLVAEQDAALHGAKPTAAVAVLKGEFDNIGRAWRWAVANKRSLLIGKIVEPMATFYELLGLLPQAENLFISAVEQFESTSPNDQDAHLLARLMAKHVHIAIDRGEISAVEPSIERMSELVEQVWDESVRAELHFIRGRAARYAGQHDYATEELRQAVRLFHAQGEHNSLVASLNNLGDVLARNQMPDEALAQHHKALQLAEEMGDARGQALSLSFVGHAYYYKEDYQQSLAYFQRAVPLFEQLEDLLAIARTTGNIGFIQCRLGDYDGALSNTESAIALFHEVGASPAFTFDVLGNVCVVQGDYEQARLHYMRGLERMQAAGWRLEEAQFLGSLSMLDMAMGQYEVAETQLCRGLAIVEEIQSDRQIAVFNGHLGELYRQDGRATEALKHLDAAIAGLRNAGSRYHTGHYLVEKGALLLDQEEYEEALPLIEEGLQMALEIGRRPTVFPARLSLARAAHAQGDSEGALERLQELLDGVERSADHAAILYEMWHITGDRSHAIAALTLYGELATNTPNITYQLRQEQLRSAVGSL